MTEKNNICIYGAVNNKIDKLYIEKGIELGKRIAEENMGIVFSGMKSGISGAVAEGASKIENANGGTLREEKEKKDIAHFKQYRTKMTLAQKLKKVDGRQDTTRKENGNEQSQKKSPRRIHQPVGGNQGSHRV